jgi:hypothetical protein
VGENITPSGSFSFPSYSTTYGPFLAPGDYSETNTASFITNDTKTRGNDSWTVIIHVKSSYGTLTIGYWKTHAGFTGNNPDNVTKYLPIWLGKSTGTKSVQVTNASQAVSILQMNGTASNGINKLYAQLLATTPTETDRAGNYFIDLTQLQQKHPELSTKMALLPFLRETPFYALEMVCDHIPPWFDHQFPGLRLCYTLSHEDSDGKHVVITHAVCKE